MSNIVPRVGKTSGNDNTRSGFEKLLSRGQNYQIAQLKIPARCNLPLQTDYHQSKHLTVLSGIIHLTLSDDVIVLVADESIYVPQGMLHGLENRADHAALVVSVDYMA